MIPASVMYRSCHSFRWPAVPLTLLFSLKSKLQYCVKASRACLLIQRTLTLSSRSYVRSGCDYWFIYNPIPSFLMPTLCRRIFSNIFGTEGDGCLPSHWPGFRLNAEELPFYGITRCDSSYMQEHREHQFKHKLKVESWKWIRWQSSVCGVGKLINVI